MVFLARGDLAGPLGPGRREQQQLLLRLTPAAFGDDRLGWGLALAEVAELRQGMAPLAGGGGGFGPKAFEAAFRSLRSSLT